MQPQSMKLRARLGVTRIFQLPSHKSALPVMLAPTQSTFLVWQSNCFNHSLRSEAGNSMFERLRSPQWAAIPLRLIVGFGFMEHGYAKLIKGPTVFVSILHALGVPNAHVLAWLTILIELFGGFAVLSGAFIPLVSVPLAGVLLGAMLSVHLRYGFS